MASIFVENRIRPVKLTAKNPLFADPDEGAAAWGRIASHIETCKRNGVEPYVWLKSTLEKIASRSSQIGMTRMGPRPLAMNRTIRSRCGFGPRCGIRSYRWC